MVESPQMTAEAEPTDRTAPLSPRQLFASLAFLILLAVGFFADGARVRLEAKEPSSLRPVETGVPRLTRRVVLVLLDSVPVRVGTDPSIMPNLVALARRGAAGVLIAPPETVSTTGVRAMTVGTSPSFRDTLDTVAQRRFPHWTVFDDLAGRGEGVRFEGDHIWTDLLGNRSEEDPGRESARNLYANDEAALAAARGALLSGASPSFLSLHIDRTDFFAHQYGTQSAEYKRLLRQVDAEVAQFLRDVDDGATTFIITSDHGCDLFGSHGGSGDIYRRVPVVFAGGGVRPAHGFEMDGMQMPLVIAALLGTRLPGGILKNVPDAFLAMDAGDRAKLEVANASRLRAIAAFREVCVPRDIDSSIAEAGVALGRDNHGDAIRLSRLVGERLIEAVRTGSRPDLGSFLWIAVLALAAVLTFLASTTIVTGLVPALSAGAAMLLLLSISSVLRIPVLVSLAVLEVVMLSRALADSAASRARRAAIVSCVVGALLLGASAARFLYGGAALMRAGGLLVAALVPVAAAALWLFRGRLAGLGRALGEAEPWVIGSVVFALGILQPLEAVPVVLTGLLALALRAAAARWTWTALAAGGAAAFFVASQRVVFGLLGERLWPRYLYAAIAGAVALWLLSFRLERDKRWFLAAMGCLIPLWPFGFLATNSTTLSAAMHTAVVLLPWLGAAVFAWRSGATLVCAAPLLAALAYRLAPSESTFLASLSLHLAGLGWGAWAEAPAVRKRSIAACLVFSMLFVMSTDIDTISLVLVSLALLALTRLPDTLAPARTVALLAGGTLAYVRFVILDIFGHTAGVYYTLGNLDTHAGFVTMSRDVSLWWPTTLVVWKLICGSILLFVLVLSCRWLRRFEGRLVLASMAAALALAVETALELALSFGVNESRLSVSMVLVVFHAGTVLLLATGYLGYRLLLVRATPDPADGAAAP